jgi:cobalt transporter subunit CbtB
MTTKTSYGTFNLSVSQRVAAGLACAFLGIGILYAVGFAEMAVAHNAAHDTRHAVGFPCH